MENKDNGKLIVILIFFIVLSIVLGSYVIYDRFIAKDEVKDANNNSIEPNAYEKFIIDEKNKRVETVIISSDNDENDSYEIRLTADGEVIANVKAIMDDQKDIINQLLDNQVIKYFIVNVGQSDIGIGKDLVLLKEDGSISSISLDTLLLANQVIVNKNVGSLKNVVEVYSKITTPANEYEPPGYSVYAKDIDGKETDISNFIDGN